MMEHIFPELKENEDERIRKGILEHIQLCTESIPDRDKYIAWLEKQGQTFTKKDVDDAYLKCVCDAKSELEKQDKPKFEQCIQEGDEIVTNEDGTHFNVSQLERVAKKEPKFNVGDWIVKNDGKDCFSDGSYVLQITDIDCNKYKLSNGCYLREHFFDTYRLWTLKDAKDGDVLADEDNNIGIYKEIEGIDWYSHIYLGCDNCIYCGGLHAQNNTKPATKEQHDFLFSKMKEAGYEWDTEKKELRKIEQNSAWSEEDEKIALSIEQVMNCASLLNIVPEKIDKIRTWLKDLKERVQLQQEWCKDDEIGLSDTLWCCKQAASIAKDENDMGNIWNAETWLESLKERMKGE